MDTKINKRKLQAEQTKLKLMEAVEHIIATEGFTELKVQKIQKISGIDKKLIYFHFGDLDGLIKEFLRSKDFWINDVAVNNEVTKDTAKALLRDQFSKIFQNDLLSQLIVWEISAKNESLLQIAEEREEIGNKIIQALNKTQKFKRDVSPVFALLVAGIYYLTIHAKVNGSTFCGLNINLASDRKRLLDCVDEMVDALD